MRHDELMQLASGYALATLEPAEMAEFEAHLAGCYDCSVAVAEMRALTEAMPLAAAETSPPPHLRDRVLTAARRTALARPAATTAPPWWRRLFRPASVASAFAVLLIAVVALASWADQTRAENAISQQRLDLTYDGIRIMAEAERWWRFGGTELAAEARGTLAFSRERGAACLVLWGLPELSEGSYQAAFSQAGEELESRRLWRYGDTLWLILELEPTQLDSLWITVASPGEKPEPSSPVLARVPLSDS